MKQVYVVKKSNLFVFLVSKLVCFSKRFSVKRKIVFDFPKTMFRHTPVIILSDHSTFESYFSAASYYPWTKSFHAVVGLMNFKKNVPGFLVKGLNCIPMKSYVPDLPALFNMTKVIKAGHSLLLFPEGINSYCGMTQPIFPATASFLKQMQVDVVVARTDGAFLSKPTFCRGKRKGGTAETHFSHLFSKEELSEKSMPEIEEKLTEALRYNDFLWNAERHYRYFGKLPLATGLEKILYLCPKCAGENTLYTRDNKIICKKCGNTVLVNEEYGLVPENDITILPYKRIDEWYVTCRKHIRQKIRKCNDCVFSFEVRFNKYDERFGRKMFVPEGEGTFTVDVKGIKYHGTRSGSEWDYFVPIQRISGASNRGHKYLVIYDAGETMVFEFSGCNADIVMAEAAIEEFHALVDKAWDTAIMRAYFQEEIKNVE